MNKTQEALKMAIEALKDACGLTPRDAHFCKAIQICKEALAELQEHDNKVIEKCAKVCESMESDGYSTIEQLDCAEAIRALKG